VNRTQQTLLLARREFIQRAKSKAFMVTMLLIVGLILAAGPLLALLEDEPEPIAVGLVGLQPENIESLLDQRAAIVDVTVNVTRYDSLEQAEAALTSGRARVILVDGTELVWLEDESFVTRQVLSDAITAAQQRALIDELNLSAEDVAGLIERVQLESRTLVTPDPEEVPRQVGAFVGMMVLYITILIFGQFVAMGTVEEKQNRVVEVVLARVRPSQILVGKVIGIGTLGLVQLLVLAAAALVAASIVDVEGVSLTGIGVEIVLGVLFWFLLGYTLYAFMYAALGSTVSRQEDLQGVLMLPVAFILPGFFIAQIATENPDVTFIRLASFFPPWTPMVMPVRAAVGSAPAWEVAVSIVLVLLTIVLLVRLGARVYTGALLRTGGKVKLREAWRSAGA
jgi:ABC-2 type transport system permease protein